MFRCILHGRRFAVAVTAAVMFAGSCAAQCFGQSIDGAKGVSRAAIVASKEAAGDFSAALKQAGIKTEHYEDSAQDWERLGKKLGDYDIVLAGPEMKNAAAESVAHNLLRFMENGGAVIANGVDSPESVDWLKKINPKCALLLKSPKKKESSVKPGDNTSLLNYPEPVAIMGPLQYGFAFDGKNISEWELAGRSGVESMPCVLVKRFEKGVLIVSTFRFQDAGFMQNAAKLLELQRMGMAYVRIRHQFDNRRPFGDLELLSLGKGKTTLTLQNTSGGKLALQVAMTVAGKDQSRTFLADASRDKNDRFNVDLPLVMDLRGPVKSTLVVTNTQNGERATLLAFADKLPEFLEIDPPTYRGMISTARRDSLVHFAVTLNPVTENVNGAKIQISVSGADGKTIAGGQVVATGEGRIPVSLALPADLPPGTYTLNASTMRNGIFAETAKAAFKIVPVRPGQFFVDQDGVILSEGKPFFPLGLYHVAGKEIEAAAQTGVNMIQLWKWDAKPENLAKLKQYGIRIIYEEQSWGEIVATRGGNHPRGLPGGGIREQYHFESNPKVRALAESVRDDPTRTLAMWYTADEPGFGMLPHVQRIRDFWYSLDENHPTYIVSTGDPRLEAGADVFGVDVYPVYYGRHNPLRRVGDLMDSARAGVQYRKPVIAVLQAFGNNKRHGEKPEEVRCMSYIALAHGVHGVFWYCWKETGDNTGEEGAGYHPETVKVLTDVIAEIKNFAPALLEPDNRTLKSPDGRVHAILCGSQATGRFLVYVNSEYEQADTTLLLPELDGATLEPLFNGPAGAVKNGKLSLKLPPLATGAFRIKK